jgi:hypothetical protein
MSTNHKQNRWWIQNEASNVTIRSFSKPFFLLCTRPIFNGWLLYADSLLTVVWTLTLSQFHSLLTSPHPSASVSWYTRTYTLKEPYTDKMGVVHLALPLIYLPSYFFYKLTPKITLLIVLERIPLPSLKPSLVTLYTTKQKLPKTPEAKYASVASERYFW